MGTVDLAMNRVVPPNYLWPEFYSWAIGAFDLTDDSWDPAGGSPPYLGSLPFGKMMHSIYLLTYALWDDYVQRVTGVYTSNDGTAGSADGAAGDVRSQSGWSETLVDSVEHTIDLQRDAACSRAAATSQTDHSRQPDRGGDEEHRPGDHREHDGAGRRHSGKSGAGRCATSGARLIDLDTHDCRPGSRVAGTHAHASYPSQSSFTGREAHRADGASDDSPALGPYTPPVAESVSSEVVAVDEPGVKAGQDI